MVQKEWAMVEGIHMSYDEDFLFKRKHHKIQQTFSHTFRIVATNNLEKPTPRYC
jgi:hypothetical protein